MQGAGAVVAAADRDPAGVQHLHHVVRVHAGDVERDGAPPVHRLCRPQQDQSLDAGELVQRVRGELHLVRGDRVHADGGQVADGRAQPHGLRDRRGAGLEAVRRRCVGRVAHLHHLDHLAAAHVRRQLGEQVVAAPEHADAGGPAHLVPGERHQVRAQPGHVGGLVRHPLRRVHHHHRADGVAPAPRSAAMGLRRAEHVGHPRHRHDAGPLVDQVLLARGVQVEASGRR